MPTNCFPLETDFHHYYPPAAPVSYAPKDPNGFDLSFVPAAQAPQVFSRDHQSMFSHGLMTMQTIMVHLNHSANDLFAQMNKKSAEARDAQEQANAVESIMAKLTDKDKKLEITQAIGEYMANNNILVDGMGIQDYLKTKGSPAKLDRGDLLSVKSALETFAGRASDFNQQNQLKLQQVMQNYSTSSQLMQSVQSMLAEMTKGTAAAIR